MKKIKVAIIGCGYWGKNYVRVFNQLPHATVTDICDLSLDRLTTIKQTYPLIATHTDFNHLLKNSEAKAVVIATPSITHYHLSHQCLLAKKHVLVEKPLATTLDQAEDLRQLAAKMDNILMVGHTFLYNSGIKAMKKHLNHPDFGQIHYLHATRTNLGPIRQDVNVVWDLAVHDIAIFNYLLDAQPQQVSAVGRSLLGNTLQDVAFITLSYPNNIIANIKVSWAEPTKIREVVVVGSKKRLVFDDTNKQTPLKIFEAGTNSHQPNQSPPHPSASVFDINTPPIEATEPLKIQSTHFLNCINSGHLPLTDGLNGRNVVNILQAINQSIGAYGQPIQLSPISGE